MAYFNKSTGSDFRNVKISNNIASIPFHELGTACAADSSSASEHVAEFISTYGLKHKPWLYPQLLNIVGKWTLSRNESGLFSGKQLLRDNCKASNPTNLGYAFFCLADVRALNGQYKPDAAPYCALVPLILAAFKRSSGIKYSEWDKAELGFVVNKLLCTAMTTVPPDYTTEELLQFRTTGLTVKSGKTEGQVKSPVTTYSLNGLPWEHGDKVGMGQLPQLVRMMLCQTWCAHPNNRNEYMILDPVDWENVPKPLIEADPLASSAVVPKKVPVSDKLPWDE